MVNDSFVVLPPCYEQVNNALNYCSSLPQEQALILLIMGFFVGALLVSFLWWYHYKLVRIKQEKARV